MLGIFLDIVTSSDADSNGVRKEHHGIDSFPRGPKFKFQGARRRIAPNCGWLSRTGAALANMSYPLRSMRSAVIYGLSACGRSPESGLSSNTEMRRDIAFAVVNVHHINVGYFYA